MSKLKKTIGKIVRANPIFWLLLLCGTGTIAVALFVGPLHLLDSILPGYVYDKEPEEEPLQEPSQPASPPPEQKPAKQPEQSIGADGNILVTYDNIFSIKSFDIIKKNLYNVDRTAYVYDSDLDFEKLLSIGTHVDFHGDKPKILIFHTHSQEEFSDSREGIEDDTIVGVGSELAEILSEKYGIPVLHHKGVYDMADGEIMRGGSYEAMEEGVRKVLEENPSIEVMIDLHRDSLPNNRRLLTEINGKDTAQIMFFNGICRLNENGMPVPTEGLNNEYLTENLALSLKMKLLTNERFPDFSRKIYIRPYRYSLHMRPNSLLIEVGSDTNTLEEAKNAMEPLAEILVKAFS